MTMFGSPWFGSEAAAFTIDQSCRFASGDSAMLTRTPAGNGNLQTWTLSFWMKRGLTGAAWRPVVSTQWSGTYETLDLRSDKFLMRHNNVDRSNAATNVNTNDWAHVVWRVNTPGSSGDRNRLYVNGTEVSYTGSDASLNANSSAWNTSSYANDIANDSAAYFDGYLAEMIFLDGTSAGPGEFGETVDSVWVPKNFSGSYGTNGFYLDFADSADLGADQSGNSNDFTSSGLDAADQVLDSPSNNFAVLNPSDPSGTTLTYSECNLKAMRAGASFADAYSSMSFDSGKWYAEVIFGAGSPPNSLAGMIAGETNPAANRYLGQDTYTYAIWPADGRKINSGSWTAYATGVSITKANDGSGDVLGIYIDADNGDLYFSENGTIMNSGTAAFSGITGPFRFAVSSEYSSFIVINFGQDDTFAGLKTSGSAAASDDNGYGKFYDTIALSGYLALCSQNGGTV